MSTVFPSSTIWDDEGSCCSAGCCCCFDEKAAELSPVMVHVDALPSDASADAEARLPMVARRVAAIAKLGFIILVVWDWFVCMKGSVSDYYCILDARHFMVSKSVVFDCAYCKQTSARYGISRYHTQER